MNLDAWGLCYLCLNFVLQIDMSVLMNLLEGFIHYFIYSTHFKIIILVNLIWMYEKFFKTLTLCCTALNQIISLTTWTSPVSGGRERVERTVGCVNQMELVMCRHATCTGFGLGTWPSLTVVKSGWPDAAGQWLTSPSIHWA